VEERGKTDTRRYSFINSFTLGVSGLLQIPTTETGVAPQLEKAFKNE
jgi:hypothetical protein